MKTTITLTRGQTRRIETFEGHVHIRDSEGWSSAPSMSWPADDQGLPIFRSNAALSECCGWPLVVSGAAHGNGSVWEPHLNRWVQETWSECIFCGERGKS